MVKRKSDVVLEPLSAEQIEDGKRLLVNGYGELPTLHQLRLIQLYIVHIFSTNQGAYRTHAEYNNWLTMVHQSGDIAWVRECCYEEPLQCPCAECQGALTRFQEKDRRRRTFVNDTKSVTFIYLMKNSRNNLVKIGYSVDPSFREKTLQSEEPEIDLIASWIGSCEDEQALHRRYKEKRVRGEWFRLSADDVDQLVEEFVGVTA